VAGGTRNSARPRSRRRFLQYGLGAGAAIWVPHNKMIIGLDDEDMQ
jgi:hypothetical protein